MPEYPTRLIGDPHFPNHSKSPSAFGPPSEQRTGFTDVRFLSVAGEEHDATKARMGFGKRTRLHQPTTPSTNHAERSTRKIPTACHTLWFELCLSYKQVICISTCSYTRLYHLPLLSYSISSSHAFIPHPVPPRAPQAPQAAAPQSNVESYRSGTICRQIDGNSLGGSRWA